MFQIVHFQMILEGQCLNIKRLTAPLYILLGFYLKDKSNVTNVNSCVSSNIWKSLRKYTEFNINECSL